MRLSAAVTRSQCSYAVFAGGIGGEYAGHGVTIKKISAYKPKKAIVSHCILTDYAELARHSDFARTRATQITIRRLVAVDDSAGVVVSARRAYPRSGTDRRACARSNSSCSSRSSVARSTHSDLLTIWLNHVLSRRASRTQRLGRTPLYHRIKNALWMAITCGIDSSILTRLLCMVSRSIIRWDALL